VYQKYRELQQSENALDFSMIQKELFDLIESNQEVLENLRNRYKYFMIDEYQDTNSIQERILLKLLNDEQNICVVGDDDQGLYRFRGATIRNILEFENNFKAGCKRIELTKNYRSHSGIINFYNEWMKQQDWNGKNGEVYRFEKEVVSGKDISKEGKYHSVIKVSAEGEENWKVNILKYLKEMKYKGIISDWNQAVFLFKSVQNKNAVALEKYLEENGINVYAPRSNMFFEREEIKLAIGALCTLYMDYYAAPEYHNEFAQYLETCIVLFKEKLRQDKDLITFFKLAVARHRFVEKTSLDYAFSGLFYQLLQFQVFADYIGDMNSQLGVIDSRPARNFAIFSRLLVKFEYLENITVLTANNIKATIKRFLSDYLAFLYDGGMEEYEDSIEYAPSGCVSFMTIHQSKGLEFPIVFVCSLWDVPKKQYTELDQTLQDNFYHKAPFEPIENTKSYDFMRLYYTAFSRAQNILCLSCPERDKGAKVPSAYFRTLYSELPSYTSISDEEWSEVKLDTIKQANIKHEYAFTSHVIVYENCPMQYKFFKELEFAPVRYASVIYGTLVHQTIEDIHKTVIQDRNSKITEERVTDWFNINYENLKKKEHSYLSEQARQMAIHQVMVYVNREQNHWDRIREAEVDVSLIEKDYILRGKIDLLRNENGKLDIIDFKSDAKPDINSEEGRDRLEKYKRQLEIYAYIIENRYNEKVENMYLYYTKAKEDENPYVSFTKHPLVIKQTIKKVSDVVKKIENHDYSMKERKASNCNECDMRHYCEKYWCPSSS
jgi:DNA helicase-2/ATP-dependent DNA helicase PcrA